LGLNPNVCGSVVRDMVEQIKKLGPNPLKMTEEKK